MGTSINSKKRQAVFRNPVGCRKILEGVRDKPRQGSHRMTEVGEKIRGRHLTSARRVGTIALTGPFSGAGSS